MIKEDHVSFEIAKLLKEKQFNEICRAAYTDDGKFITNHNYYSQCEDECIAPTHQMVMKWLRKEHNILLFLLPAQENGKLVYLVEVWTWNEEEGIYESTYTPMPRKEPEQAVEAALKYCLENLI